MSELPDSLLAVPATRRRHLVHKPELIDSGPSLLEEMSNILTGISPHDMIKGVAARDDLDSADLLDVARQIARDAPTASYIRPTQPDPVSCVYFIRCGQHVKIGTTTQGARRRFASMQLPPSAELVAVIPNFGVEEEHALHQMFAEQHARGEWFTSCPELEEVIAAHACRLQ